MKTKKLKPGSIFKASSKTQRGCAYGLVICLDRQAPDKGFYYVKCDKWGAIQFHVGLNAMSAANYINHSNMLLSCYVKEIGNADLEKRNGFYITGIERIDMYMAQLDGRYQEFIKDATPAEVSLYYFNEDRNYHEENARIVAEWFANRVEA